MDRVPVGTRKIEEYEKLVKSQVLNDLKRKSADLKGLKVVNISSTAFGGGVAELLYSIVPLMNDLGLDAQWFVISGDTSFYTVTKNIHNGLQGMDFLLTDHMAKIYEERNRINANSFTFDADIVIIHDPQPLAMISFIEKKKREKIKWIWRAHIDLSAPQKEIIDYIGNFTAYYDMVVASLEEYKNPALNVRKFKQILPTIDPISAKNNDLSKGVVTEILERLSIDANRPTLTQVSRFDPWKDPFGVIDTYRLAKKEIENLQLLMVASMAADDPEGWHYFEKTARYAGLDESIKLFSNVTGVGNVEVNAIQRASDVIIQKSTREGFGLVVSEAMWKSKPVIGTRVGGIKKQIIDKNNGFLIENTEQAAEKVKFLFQNKKQAERMGKNAHEYVKENFLTPRLINDWLDVFRVLV